MVLEPHAPATEPLAPPVVVAPPVPPPLELPPEEAAPALPPVDAFPPPALLPPVAVLIPLYTWFQALNLNKTPVGLLLAYVGFHTPIVVWMLHSFFEDVPGEIIEAARIDGCTPLQQMLRIAVPLVRTGIISSGLLVAVFIWNEFFLAVNLTATNAGTSPIFLVGFISSEGLFLARLCAAATLVSLPVLIAGSLYLAGKVLAANGEIPD